MPSPDDILAYKAMQDEQNRISAPTAGAIGAGVGLLAGVTQRGRFGQRMAGGASTAIAGGLLGVGIQQIALQESPAARALANMQAKERAGGQVTPEEMRLYESALAEAYNSQLGIA